MVWKAVDLGGGEFLKLEVRVACGTAARIPKLGRHSDLLAPRNRRVCIEVPFKRDEVGEARGARETLVYLDDQTVPRAASRHCQAFGALLGMEDRGVVPRDREVRHIDHQLVVRAVCARFHMSYNSRQSESESGTKGVHSGTPEATV